MNSTVFRMTPDSKIHNLRTANSDKQSNTRQWFHCLSDRKTTENSHSDFEMINANRLISRPWLQRSTFNKAECLFSWSNFLQLATYSNHDWYLILSIGSIFKMTMAAMGYCLTSNQLREIECSQSTHTLRWHTWEPCPYFSSWRCWFALFLEFTQSSIRWALKIKIVHGLSSQTVQQVWSMSSA